MKIKFWQKCLIVVMTVAVLTATFVATAFAMPIDILSHTEYFTPYRIELLNTSSQFQSFVLSNNTTISNMPTYDVYSSFYGGEEDITWERTDVQSEFSDAVIDSFVTYFSFETVKFYFKDFYRLGNDEHNDIVEIRCYDTNYDGDWNGTFTVTWNEQYYDSENNYQFTIDTHEETVSNDNGIIAILPFQFIERTNPMEHSTITDFTITANCQFGLSTCEIYTEPIVNDSITYGVNMPPSVIPQVVNPNVIEWLTTSLNSFMNAEIFGNGITIGTVLGIAVATPLIIWFLKLLAGG